MMYINLPLSVSGKKSCNIYKEYANGKTNGIKC